LKTVTVAQVYDEIEHMDEGIDQVKIITDLDYQSVVEVKDDDVREKRMKKLHPPRSLFHYQKVC
jgi:hypothetical protein